MNISYIVPFQVSPTAMASLPTTALDLLLAPNTELPPTAMATPAMVRDKNQPIFAIDGH
jgi:hypothetical protein